MQSINIGDFVKNYGVVISIIFTACWYRYTKHIERIIQTKALVKALLTEVTVLGNCYKDVELVPWEKLIHNNAQCFEEEYMTVYHNCSDKLSLLPLDDIGKIITFYTYLKAHMDTLRVLAKEQNTYNVLSSSIMIFGNIGRSSTVESLSLNNFRSTYKYALESQMKVYIHMNDAVFTLNNCLNECSKEPIHERVWMFARDRIVDQKTWVLCTILLVFSMAISFYIYLDKNGVIIRIISEALYIILCASFSLCILLILIFVIPELVKRKKNR